MERSCISTNRANWRGASFVVSFSVCISVATTKVGSKGADLFDGNFAEVLIFRDANVSFVVRRRERSLISRRSSNDSFGSSTVISCTVDALKKCCIMVEYSVEPCPACLYGGRMRNCEIRCRHGRRETNVESVLGGSSCSVLPFA